MGMGVPIGWDWEWEPFHGNCGNGNTQFGTPTEPILKLAGCFAGIVQQYLSLLTSIQATWFKSWCLILLRLPEKPGKKYFPCPVDP